jgi:hypothetical protein
MKSYRKRKRQRGRGDYQALPQINTANQNLVLKPALQIPGQIFNDYKIMVKKDTVVALH